MDEVDRAECEMNALEAMRCRRPWVRELEACGHCWFCGQTVNLDHRFCDAECAWGWKDEHGA